MSSGWSSNDREDAYRAGLPGRRGDPAEAYYGAHTARAIANFQVTDTSTSQFPALIAVLAAVKEAAALINNDLGRLDSRRAAAIVEARDGALVSDFEHVTRGPVEWDLVFTDEAARAAYDAAAAELGLRPLDERLLRVMESGRMIQLVACLPMAPQLPGLLDGLRPAVEHWRAGPPPRRLL